MKKVTDFLKALGLVFRELKVLVVMASGRYFALGLFGTGDQYAQNHR
ncbi:MAG: hypothetical protein LC776_14850 [Acidobacteria bacterium]|nr:hypothetical protein [Acidobacteriota bacterium]